MVWCDISGVSGEPGPRGGVGYPGTCDVTYCRAEIEQAEIRRLERRQARKMEKRLKRKGRKKENKK